MILSWIMLSNYTVGMIIGGNATEPFAPIVYSSADHTRYGDWLRLRKLCEFLPNENPRPDSIERGFGQEFVLHLAKEGATANRALLRNVSSGEPALPDSTSARDKDVLDYIDQVPRRSKTRYTESQIRELTYESHAPTGETWLEYYERALRSIDGPPKLHGPWEANTTPDRIQQPNYAKAYEDIMSHPGAASILLDDMFTFDKSAPRTGLSGIHGIGMMATSGPPRPTNKDELWSDADVIVDTGASVYISGFLEDFIGGEHGIVPTPPDQQIITGVGGGCPAKGMGTISWVVKDDDGEPRIIEGPAYYLPGLKARLLSPQTMFRLAQGGAASIGPQGTCSPSSRGRDDHYYRLRIQSSSLYSSVERIREGESQQREPQTVRSICSDGTNRP